MHKSWGEKKGFFVYNCIRLLWSAVILVKNVCLWSIACNLAGMIGDLFIVPNTPDMVLLYLDVIGHVNQPLYLPHEVMHKEISSIKQARCRQAQSFSCLLSHNTSHLPWQQVLN